MATRRIRVVFLLRNNLAKKELQSGKGKTCFKKTLELCETTNAYKKCSN